MTFNYVQGGSDFLYVFVARVSQYIQHSELNRLLIVCLLFSDKFQVSHCHYVEFTYTHTCVSMQYMI